MATCLAWQSIGRAMTQFLFSAELLIIVVVAGAGMLLFTSFMLRIIRGKEEPNP